MYFKDKTITKVPNIKANKTSNAIIDLNNIILKDLSPKTINIKSQIKSIYPPNV